MVLEGESLQIGLELINIYVPNGNPVDTEKYEYKNASKEPLTYFERLMGDVVNRTSTAMDQSHCLKVMELAIKAQKNAIRLGNIK